jgi:hypothetical protein
MNNAHAKNSERLRVLSALRAALRPTFARLISLPVSYRTTCIVSQWSAARLMQLSLETFGFSLPRLLLNQFYQAPQLVGDRSAKHKLFPGESPLQRDLL